MASWIIPATDHLASRGWGMPADWDVVAGLGTVSDKVFDWRASRRGAGAIDPEVRSGTQPPCRPDAEDHLLPYQGEGTRGNRVRLEWSVSSGNHSVANHCFQWEYAVHGIP